MITDIPTPEEFFNSGVDYLNVAWDVATKLLLERLDATESSETVELSQIEDNDKYLFSAQPSLNSSITLVQQASEFIIKSKIAEISPYLLIANTPQNYPKGSTQKDISFSDFRTIDAQDLIRVHNTVSEERLPDTFIQWHNSLRNLRNKIMHTVDKKILITDENVVVLILEVCDFLIGSQTWISLRDEYLQRTPDANLSRNYLDEGEHDVLDGYRLGQLSREILNVIEFLEPAKVKEFFGFDKKKRRHICLNCLSIRQKEYFFELKDEELFNLSTAYFIEEKNGSKVPFCIFCKEHAIIETES